MEARAEPKYKVAYGALLSRLVSGRYPIGGRLPTEDELARTFDISRVTIRRSLDMLVNEGFLERRQGSGYTVISLSPPSSMCLSSFTDAMLRAGREPSSRLIRISTLEAGAHGEELIDELRDERLTCIERLRLVDNEPQMLVRTWVPARLLANASADDFPGTGHEQSILRILRQRFGLEWNAACEDISPAGAPADVAQYLQIEPGRPLLVQACTAFDEDGSVVFYEQVYRIGKVSFNLTGASREVR
ncbi:GntR family transcriptional regulator [Hoeflea poritis]|uniref:GntR family transcriptional regulator n=1 Tax=Hoeflea poritis TaxID=2993659 RepID=A0ABT4VM24_9HYPH|nr:GntR family transcriptional regulator [Hoeflea poritis]MDA4845777.1 GntR family transcriptional regulator [Hoeflea poritis]